MATWEKYATAGVDDPIVGGFAKRYKTLLGVSVDADSAGCNMEKF
jgi:hypothetical protein